MKAGFGKGEIVFPQEMFPVEGFCGVHDHPQIRIMALESGGERMALAAVELVNVPAELIGFMQEKIGEVMDIPKAHVWIHMTHAITTPHEPGWRQEITEELAAKKALFGQAVKKAAAEAAEALAKDYGEAVCGWGSGTCEANINRDVETSYGWWTGLNPDGCSDHSMTVLKVTGTDGIPKGLLVSYGIKPCAVDNSGMKDGTRLVSAECCGMACVQAEAVLGVPVLFVMSAAGDQVPRKMSLLEVVTEDGNVVQKDEGVEAGFVYAQEAADLMTESILEIAAGTECTQTEPVTAWDSLSFRWTVRKGGPRSLKKQVAYLPETERDVFSAEFFRLGDAVFIAEKPELNACTGLAIKEKSPFAHTVIMSMVNGEMKYLPDLVSYAQGTFEAQSSYFMPGAAECFTEEAETAMKRLRG